MSFLNKLFHKHDKKTYKGRNDWKHNHNKYGVKVATDNNCIVYSSGAIEPFNNK